jgi:monovalent cation:H+ antiporter-2, CPA2 family
MTESEAGLSALPQLLVLLAFSVLVVALFRRLTLPPIVGYLAVGMVLGPHALDLASERIAPILSELGVVFLVFTLGLEFSLPRLMAMRREALGIGGAQVVLTTGAITATLLAFGVPWHVAVLVGGALAMSSTAIVIRQLGEQGELNRTHSRVAIGILLFQDLAFVPLLALESAFSGSMSTLDARTVANAVLRAAVALALVLTFLRWLVRPLFHEIGRSRSTELFTLTALLVSLAAAWATHAVGLSMALGAFLAGMLLAETEYRHQIEIVIRPFRDVLLGLFFITIGTLLDLQLLFRQIWLVLLLVIGLQFVKAAIIAAAARFVVGDLRKSLRAGIILAQGGEFGFALLTLMLNDQLADGRLVQPLLAATVVGMVISPLLIRHNGRIADAILRRKHKAPSALDREIAAAAAQHATKRDHVIVCGFGRVGQNIARVLEREDLHYIALDLDPNRVRSAISAGDPVVFGDGAQPAMLNAVGLEHCRALVLTFAEPDVSLNILRSVRELRPTLPVLVRTQDDAKLEALQAAGATEVVPETLEASLMLASHLLLLLDVPAARVFKTVGDIRNNRYALLRRLFHSDDPEHLVSASETRETLHTVVLPPHAFAVGKTLASMNFAYDGVTVTAIRREGLIDRQPDADTTFCEGDVVIISGTAEALEHGETRLLMG